MDEAAVAVRPVMLVKVMLALLGGFAASFMAPLSLCLAWVGGALALEVWCWIVTGAYARREPIDARVRGRFIAYYACVNLWWLLLAAVLWSAGSPVAQASGMVVFAAVISVFVMLFHTTPAVFVLAGAAPAVAALAVLATAGGIGWGAMAPLGLVLGLSMTFCLGRAFDAPSVQEANRRINESLSLYRALAENVTDVISRTNLAGVYEYASPASLAMFGYAPEELIGTSRGDYLHPDDLPDLLMGLRGLLAEPLQSQTFSARVRHKDGRWLWMQTSVKLLIENGEPVGVIGVSRDVTERMEADRALRQAKMEAEEANRAKADFLANVSHEIRTPMNGVLGALQLLEREPISPEGRELMRQAKDCGRMLSQLLNDVLDFSKIEAGQLELAPEPMDVGDALEGVTALLGSQARAKGVDLRCEVVGDDLWIEGDPVRLQQAMYNLVGNAVKFTDHGGVVARLRVETLDAERRRIRFEVADTGIGMSPEAQEHLFERFRQADGDTARRFGGTGLGLSITQALVRLMGGEIGFTSTEGEGSTFRLDFTARSATPLADETIDEAVLEGLDVLLVDDNATNRLVARTMLGRLGARVQEAEDGVRALEAVHLARFDLILMDVQMPHMDGMAATRAIRGLPDAAAQTPIIGLTANAMVHQRAAYLAAGMNGVVAKPISAAVLLGEIARLVAQDDSTPEARAMSA